MTVTKNWSPSFLFLLLFIIQTLCRADQNIQICLRHIPCQFIQFLNQLRFIDVLVKELSGCYTKILTDI